MKKIFLFIASCLQVIQVYAQNSSKCEMQYLVAIEFVKKSDAIKGQIFKYGKHKKKKVNNQLIRNNELLFNIYPHPVIIEIPFTSERAESDFHEIATLKMDSLNCDICNEPGVLKSFEQNADFLYTARFSCIYNDLMIVELFYTKGKNVNYNFDSRIGIVLKFDDKINIIKYSVYDILIF